MLASPAKRRKTSPTTSVPISNDAPNRPLTPDASQSQTAPERARDAPVDESTPSRSQKRASFRSPTKASLARYNPKLVRETAPRPITRSQPRPRTSITDSTTRFTRSAGRDSSEINTILVQQVLGGRRNGRAQEIGEDSDPQRTPPDVQYDDQNARKRKTSRPGHESFSAAIARTFDAIPPPSPLSQREPLRPRQASGPLPTPENSQNVPDKANGAQLSNPQATSNPPLVSTDRNSKVPPEYDDLFGLFSRPDRRSVGADAEPELPPTPIQLGISVQLERPRGLESLSSGSRRRRFREGGAGKTNPLKQRNRDEEMGTSSPLKRRSRVLPENEQLGTVTKKSNGQKQKGKESILARAATPDADREAVASGVERSEDEEQPDSDSDPETFKQREVLSSLKKQLRHLEREFVQLTSLVEDGDAAPEDDSFNEASQPLDPSLLALLTSSNPSCDPLLYSVSSTDQTPPNPLRSEILDTLKSSIAIPSGTDPLPYLTLFAPGNLTLSAHTRTVMHDQTIYQLHTLDLAAPPPFPAHVFGATIDVLVDSEAEAVRRITIRRLGRDVPKALKRRRKSESSTLVGQGETETAKATWQKTSLGRWVANRLKPGGLHALDVGGLVWGIGRWWDAAVERARLWRRVQKTIKFRSNSSSSDHHKDDEDEDDREMSTVAELLPHLQRDGMIIPIPIPGPVPAKPGPSSSSTNSSTPSSIALHIHYTLTLDWSGEVTRHDVGVCVSGVDASTEAAVKEVFGMLVGRKRRKRGDGGDGEGEKEKEWKWKRVWDAVEGVGGVLGGRGDG